MNYGLSLYSLQLSLIEVATSKGTKQNPQHVTVRQESSKNDTLSVTLSKSVLDILDDEIKKGDILVEWADPTTKTIHLKKKA